MVAQAKQAGDAIATVQSSGDATRKAVDLPLLVISGLTRIQMLAFPGMTCHFVDAGLNLLPSSPPAYNPPLKFEQNNFMLSENQSLLLLRLIHVHLELSQRELAHKMGVSLSKANYCLRALIAKGLIKLETFQKSKRNMPICFLYPESKKKPTSPSSFCGVRKPTSNRRLRTFGAILS